MLGYALRERETVAHAIDHANGRPLKRGSVLLPSEKRHQRSVRDAERKVETGLRCRASRADRSETVSLKGLSDEQLLKELGLG